MSLAVLGISMTLGLPAQAQNDERQRYSECHVHMVNSTTCGHGRTDVQGNNFSTLQLRERNDTVGLTYLLLQCSGNGEFGMFLESKNPLVTQQDFDAERTPRVLFRVDNGPLKPIASMNAQQLTEDGTPLPDLNTVELRPQIMADAIGAAKSRVQVVVERLGGWTTLTYDFPVMGFGAALRTLRSCEN